MKSTILLTTEYVLRAPPVIAEKIFNHLNALDVLWVMFLLKAMVVIHVKLVRFLVLKIFQYVSRVQLEQARHRVLNFASDVHLVMFQRRDLYANHAVWEPFRMKTRQSALTVNQDFFQQKQVDVSNV